MAHQVDWNDEICKDFIKISRMSKFEADFLKKHIDGWSRQKLAIHYTMSISTVDRLIAILKIKYDICQQFSSVMPVRRKTKEEEYEIEYYNHLLDED